MQRRDFMKVGALSAAASVAAPGAAMTGRAFPERLFQTVDFTADGLGLTPREYAVLLAERARAVAIETDAYSSGGLISELEHTFARMLGKQHGVFMPTGTLANHLAVRHLAGPDRRVLVQAESHLYNDSGDGSSVLSGLKLIPLAPGQSTFTLNEVEHWVERTAADKITRGIGVISIESPVRRNNHEMFDFDEMRNISAYARSKGIRLHMDGARMAAMPLHSGKSMQDYAALFDTVYISLHKHFNAASGAVVVGDDATLDNLAATRRMFGASLHTVWPEVALVPKYLAEYQKDYANAWAAADAFIVHLQAERRFTVEKIARGTSRFLLRVAGIASEDFAQRLRRRNILLRDVNALGQFPMQVNATILRMPPRALAAAFASALVA